MSQFAFVMGPGFTCKKLADGPDETSITITAAVGDGEPARCPNRPDDVRKIQRALNRFSPTAGGPTPKLEVDGACGRLTKAAIEHFQRAWQLPKVDKIVDADGQTIQRLRKGPGAIYDPVSDFIRHIPNVMRVVTAAKLALLLAKQHYTRPAGGLPSLAAGPASAARVVNRHFKADKNPTLPPTTRIDQIVSVFDKMTRAIGHIPQGVVIAREDPPGIAFPAYMYTFPGGFDRWSPTPGHAEPTWRGIPDNSIYICVKGRTLSRDAFTYAMVHELAHYVSPKADPIDDFAYFHLVPDLYRQLSPFIAFHNADCFSQYAFEVIGQPDFRVNEHEVS